MPEQSLVMSGRSSTRQAAVYPVGAAQVAAADRGGGPGVISVECPDFRCAQVHQVNEALDTEN